MISSGVIAIPRYVESLKQYVGNYTCNTLNGVLAHFVAPGSQGYIVANIPVPGTPRGFKGTINLVDGNADTILDIRDAQIQFELGPKDGPWTVIDNFGAQGIDSKTGKAFAFRKVGVDPSSERSLIVEFGVSDQPTFLKAWVELAAWATPPKASTI